MNFGVADQTLVRTFLLLSVFWWQICWSEFGWIWHQWLCLFGTCWNPFFSWAKKQLQKYFSWQENTWHEGTSLPNWCQGSGYQPHNSCCWKKINEILFITRATWTTNAKHKCNTQLHSASWTASLTQRAFLSARFPKPKTSSDMWTLGPSMDHWSHLQPGSAQKRRLACFFFGTCQDLSHSKVNTQHLFLCRPADQRSNVHGASFIQWKHVEGHVKHFTNALRDACVPQKQSSKTTRAENYQSHSSTSYHFWFWCCFGNRKFGGFLKFWRSQKRSTKKTNDPVNLYHPISKPLKQLHNLLLKRQRCLKRENIDVG